MLVPITTKAPPWRAHLDRALLAEHGIEAWVWNDAGGCLWGDNTLGGCSLAVEQESFAEAKRILEARPAQLPPESEAVPVVALDNGQPDVTTCTLLGALGGGALAAAWQLAPVVVALLTANAVETLAALPRMLWQTVVSAASGLLWGGAAGLLFGVGAWLLRDWRCRGSAGVTAVVALVLAYLLGDVVAAAVVLLLEALEAAG